MDFVFSDRIVIGCIILLKCEINIILKNWFLVEKKNVIVVIGIDWNCKYCFGLLELLIYIDRFCFILFFSWLMKILVVFFYFFESFIWIFFGIWIENLGCINFEKFGCLVLDIF